MTIAILALGVLTVAIRASRHEGLRDALRDFNRRWFNPRMLRLAGRAPWPVARLEHRGRCSGVIRATPVLTWPVDGGFIVPMPYGTKVDWATNLRHAGEGVLQYRGERYRVGNPRIVPAHETMGDVPSLLAAQASAIGLRHVLRADVLPSLRAGAAVPA